MPEGIGEPVEEVLVRIAIFTNKEDNTMHKGFRRVLSLVMAGAMICALSVSALAATTFGTTNKYDNNRITMTTSGSISAQATSASITITGSTSSNQNYVSIQVSYRYYTNDPTQGAVTRTRSAGKLANSVSVSNYSSDDIYVMYDATYNVDATIMTSYGPETFDPNPYHIQYQP